jgi:hypothetical protein
MKKVHTKNDFFKRTSPNRANNDGFKFTENVVRVYSYLRFESDACNQPSEIETRGKGAVFED